jgi:hypothetical protein
MYKVINLPNWIKCATINIDNNMYYLNVRTIHTIGAVDLSEPFNSLISAKLFYSRNYQIKAKWIQMELLNV